jgi:putative hemolysin
MNKKTLKIIAIVAVILGVAGVLAWKYQLLSKNEENTFCTMDAKICPDGSSVGRIPPTCEFQSCPETSVGIANPASENCIAKGGRLEIRENTDGEYGICIAPDNTECDEWALFRGECFFGGK